MRLTDQEKIERFNQIQALVEKCPLGWHEDSLRRTASTTDDDIIKWLCHLMRLTHDHII